MRRPSAERAPAWDGAPFRVEVRERGAAGGELVGELGGLAELAAGALAAGVSELGFYWMSATGLLARVRVEVASVSGPPVAAVAGDPVDALPYGLSRRELEVLTLLVGGHGNGAIGGLLALSPRTVSTHVDHILGKLGASGRTAAAARAVDEGLLGVPIAGGAEAVAALRIGRAAAAGRSPADPDRPPGGRRLRPRPLVFGAALPLSGTAAGDGREMLNGMRLAVDELNERGGIGGRALSVAALDVDISSGPAVHAGLSDLLGQGIDVLTSGYLAHQQVAHEVAAEAGVPYLHAATSGAMEARVAGAPTRYRAVFQVCPSDVHYAPRFVDVLTGLRGHRGWRATSRSLVVVQQGSWRLIDFGVAEAARRAEAAGWELSVLTVPDRAAAPHAAAGPGGAAWAEAADEVARREPAAVMVGSYFTADHVAFVRRFRRDPPRSLVYSIYAPSVPEFRRALGRDADGLLWATTTGTYADAIGRDFTRRYQRRFGADPGHSHAGIAYDRVRLMAQAWAQAGDPRDLTAVTRQLRTSPYRGVNGVYYFDTPGQTAQHYVGPGDDASLGQAHLLYQIQDGRQRILGPAPYADGVFQTPPWM